MNVIRSVTGTTTAPIPMRGKFQTIISQLLLFVPRIAGQQQQLTTSSSSNQPYFVSLPFLIIKTCILALKFAESNDGCIRAGAAFPGSSCRDTFVCATSNNAFSLLTILPSTRTHRIQMQFDCTIFRGKKEKNHCLFRKRACLVPRALSILSHTCWFVVLSSTDSDTPTKYPPSPMRTCPTIMQKE